MQQIKRAWNNQDLANKVILVTGVIMAIVCLVMGQGKYGVVFMVATLAVFLLFEVLLKRHASRGTDYFDG